MNLLPSITRTAVPVIVGWLVSLPLVVRLEDLFGVAEDDRSAWLARGLTAAITVAYYAAARFVEQRYPKLGGVLVGLGVAKAPVYPPAKTESHIEGHIVDPHTVDGIDRI